MEVDTAMTAEHGRDPAATAAAAAPIHHQDPPSEPPPPPGPAPPRPAPTYRAVDAVIEKKEDGPGCRCGHTLTAVPPVGEEGTPGYVGPRLILFGGATALEGNSAAPPSSAGSAGIRMLLFFSPVLSIYQNLFFLIPVVISSLRP